MSSNLITYNTSFSKKVYNQAAKLTENVPTTHIQRCFLILAIGCAILALVPQTGFWGGVALRSVAVTMVGVQALHSLQQKEGRKILAVQIFRLAAIALGLTGVALHMNQLVITSIAAEILFQGIELGRGAKRKDPVKSLSHLSFILVDSFVLVGAITGAWPFLVTAASISALVMFLFAIRTAVMGIINKDLGAIPDTLCYLALGCIGISSAVRAGHLYKSVPDKGRFTYTNHTDHPVNIYDKHGHLVATVEPGHSKAFYVDAKDMIHGNKVEVVTDKKDYFIRRSWMEQKWATLQHPMTPEELLTVPVGSERMVIPDQKIDLSPKASVFKGQDAYEVSSGVVRSWLPKIPVQEQQKDVLKPFLEPELGEPVRLMARIPGKPTVTLRLEGSAIQATFDQEALREVSGYIDRALTTQVGSLTEKDKEEIEIVFALDPWIFEQLTAFLYEGTLNGLSSLAEKRLLQLHQAADYFEIERMRLLCQQEIAIRLNEGTWENTDLLTKSLPRETPLNSLFALFDF